MRILLQRVSRAKCTVNEAVTGSIGKGYVLLVGIRDDDTTEVADKMLEKIKNLRVFEDASGKINQNAEAVGGAVLIVSQFTLYADCKKGNRPSFTNAANPQYANTLYTYLTQKACGMFQNVQTGIFGADMQIELVNDGPFTIYLDSDQLNIK